MALTGVILVLIGWGLVSRYGVPTGAFRSEPPRSEKLGNLGRAFFVLGAGLQLTTLLL